MKKVFFALVALLAIGLTGCKFDNAKLTISVTDTAGNPVANREVFYTDEVSSILSIALPSPDVLAGEDEWDYVVTNSQGTVKLDILLGVSKLDYYFVVYDEGARTWQDTLVTLRRGNNEEISFVVNK